MYCRYRPKLMLSTYVNISTTHNQETDHIEPVVTYAFSRKDTAHGSCAHCIVFTTLYGYISLKISNQSLWQLIDTKKARLGWTSPYRKWNLHCLVWTCLSECQQQLATKLIERAMLN